MAITRVTLDKDNPVEGYEQGVDRNTDAGDLRGLYVQNDTSNDTSDLLSRDASDNMTFTDPVLGYTATLSQLAMASRGLLDVAGAFVYIGDGDILTKVTP